MITTTGAEFRNLKHGGLIFFSTGVCTTYSRRTWQLGMSRIFFRRPCSPERNRPGFRLCSGAIGFSSWSRCQLVLWRAGFCNCDDLGWIVFFLYEIKQDLGTRWMTSSMLRTDLRESALRFFFVLVCVFSLHFFFGGVGGGVLKERMIAAKMKCLETDSESLRFQGHLLLQAQSRRKHLEWWSDGREVLHLTWRIIPGLGYAVLGSAPFISHKVRPFGRGPQPQLIRGLTLAYNHHSS